MLRAIVGARAGLSIGCRFLSAAAAAPPAAKTKIGRKGWKELRSHGYSVATCRKAVERFDRSQLKQAVEWMYESETKDGWREAEKLSSRPTPLSTVGIKIEGGAGAMVELRCGTEKGIGKEPIDELLVSLTNAVIAHAKKQSWPAKMEIMKTETLNYYVFHVLYDENGKMLREVLTDSADCMGENLRVRQAHMFKAPEGAQFYGMAPPEESQRLWAETLNVAGVSGEGPGVPPLPSIHDD